MKLTNHFSYYKPKIHFIKIAQIEDKDPHVYRTSVK